MSTRPKKKQKRPAFSAWWLILPGMLGSLLYLNTLGHQWCLDDYSVIVDNWVTQKGVDGIPDHLTHDYRYGYWNSQGDLYRPLSLIMFSVEWSLFGNDPFFGHLINVLLYGLLCSIFGLALYRWSRSATFSMIAALLFAVHPVHTEVVANIKSRDELLAALFLMLTWWAWQRMQHHKPKVLYLAISVVTFSLALLSKENAVTFLPLLPLSVYVFRKNPVKSDYWMSLILLIPTGLFLFARQAVLGSVRGAEKVSFLDNILAGAQNGSEALASAIRFVGEYLRMLVAPWPLVSDKGWNQIPLVDFSSPGVLLSLLAILGGFAILVIFWQKRKRLVFGLLWFVFTFALASNLLFLIGTSYGERLLFLPSAGFAIAVAALFRWKDTGSNPPWPGWIRSSVGYGFLGIIGIFSILTVLRNPAWYDSATLYATDIESSPRSVKLRYHHALETGKAAALIADGPERQRMLDESLKDLEIVMKAHPKYWEAFGTAGLYEFRRGNRDKALEYYTRATTLNPKASIAWSNMGIIYAERGQPLKAREVYEKAVAADPRFSDGWMNLGAIAAQMGEFPTAIRHFEEALKYDPENVRLLNMLGSSYRDSGQPEKGQVYLEKAARLGNTALQ
ncbi:MAG: tetratricopeptide repeat protein [Saprospiraceae bacterium]|nr:tetratricopeptide repeat protein [Saprospiraceae bacterium]